MSSSSMTTVRFGVCNDTLWFTSLTISTRVDVLVGSIERLMVNDDVIGPSTTSLSVDVISA